MSKRSKRRSRQRNQKRIQANDSLLQSRANLSGQAGLHFGGTRDLYATFGYPQAGTIQNYEYRNYYLRGDIAGRVVDAYPEATWREEPTIKGVSGFDDLNDRLKLWSVFQRLDRLTQLGHYGVLLLGLDGGEPLDTPAQQTNYELLYAQPHGEQTAQILEWNKNPKSPRYNLPERYLIESGPDWQGTGGARKSLHVHWTRVIHVAEKPLEHVSIGLPRLERIYNRLMDLEKLLGGSAEMYWQNIAMLLAFLADKEVNWDPKEKEAMEEQLEEMQHGLRRALRLRGVNVENVAPGLQGAQPGEHIMAQVDMISGATGIPKRILLGNEAGELASTQDETAWQGRIAERRAQFAGPCILEPFIQRGAEQGWLSGTLDEAEWPDYDALGEKGRAEVAQTVATASSAYSNTMGDQPVTEDEFREILGFQPRKSSEIEEPLDEEDYDVREAFDKSQRRREGRSDSNPDGETEV